MYFLSWSKSTNKGFDHTTIGIRFYTTNQRVKKFQYHTGAPTINFITTDIVIIFIYSFSMFGIWNESENISLDTLSLVTI